MTNQLTRSPSQIRGHPQLRGPSFMFARVAYVPLSNFDAAAAALKIIRQKAARPVCGNHQQQHRARIVRGDSNLLACARC